MQHGDTSADTEVKKEETNLKGVKSIKSMSIKSISHVNESMDKIYRSHTEEIHEVPYDNRIVETNEENMEEDLNKAKYTEIAMLEEIMRAKNPVKRNNKI